MGHSYYFVIVGLLFFLTKLLKERIFIVQDTLAPASLS